MNPFSDYIIRIYRFEKDKPRSLVGLVEEVGKKGKKGFNTYDELWEILNAVNEFPSENARIGKKTKPVNPTTKRSGATMKKPFKMPE